jgi:hypothetical protein
MFNVFVNNVYFNDNVRLQVIVVDNGLDVGGGALTDPDSGYGGSGDQGNVQVRKNHFYFFPSLLPCEIAI